MCSAMNPVGNVYCDKCNARLVPMSHQSQEEEKREAPTIKGLSLPTIPLEGQPEEKPRAEDVTAAAPAGNWLTQLRASTTVEAEEPEAPVEPVEPVEIPDWLRNREPIGEKSALVEPHPIEEAVPAAPALAEAEVPDWLRETAPAAAAPPSAEPALAEVEVPDWPREAAPAAAEPAPEEAVPAAPALAAVEVPDWLREAAPQETAPAAAEPPSAEPALAEAEVPDWLREAAPAAAAPPSAEPAPEEAPPFMGTPALVSAEAPDWLQEALPEKAVSEEAPPVPPLVGLTEEVKSTTVPEWLADVQPKATPPSAPTAPIPAEVPSTTPPESKIEIPEAEGLARAEIPEWLEDMRPHEKAVEAITEKEPLETEGLLEGLRGTLPTTPAIEIPAVHESALPAKAKEASLARAQLLQELLSRTGETMEPEIHEPGITVTERFQRLVVALVLIVPIVIILAWPSALKSKFPSIAQPGKSSLEAAERLDNVIEKVNTGTTVVVAFEYGPTEADELNQVAAPILQHLIDREVHLSIVSTRPEGLAVAKELLRHIEADQEQYTLHGYRPGGATGVSQLLADADARPGLILVLAARPAPLRRWVEQAHARWTDTPPIIAGTSALLEAAASPYLDANAGQLEGMISGLSGAAAYENRRGAEGQATEWLNALAAGHVAVIGLMLVGAVFYAFAGRRKKGE